MKSKKIIILGMSCNTEFFQKEEEICKQTWLQLADNFSKDIEYFFFTACNSEHPEECIDYKNHKIYVNSGDGWRETFYKTKRAMQLIDKEYKYQFLVRTNTSTYINIPLLYNFCNYLSFIKDKHIWGTELLMHENLLYMIGKFLIFRPSHVKAIINCSKVFDNQPDADDYVFGCLFNNQELYEQIKPGYLFPRLGGELYSIPYYSDIKKYQEVLSNYIAMSCRKYNDDYNERIREEFELMQNVHKLITYDINKGLISNIQYCNNIIINNDTQSYLLYRRKLAVVIIVSHNLDNTEIENIRKILFKYGAKYKTYIFYKNGLDIINKIDYPFNGSHIFNGPELGLLQLNDFYNIFKKAFDYILCVNNFHNENLTIYKNYEKYDLVGSENSIRNVDKFFTLTKDAQYIEKWDPNYFSLKGISYKNITL